MSRHVKIVALLLMVICAMAAEHSSSVKCGHDCKNLTRDDSLHTITHKSLWTK